MALKLQEMNYQQLGKALASGSVSEKQLRRYYREARTKAKRRYSDIVRKTHGEFGDIQKQTFIKEKNITTTQALLKEIHDVNKYLSGRSSTITGLKIQRESIIETAEKLGVDINEGNYRQWLDFLNWFNNSEFAKFFDSSSEEVAEAFNMSEGASPSDWSKALEMFIGSDSGRKKY